MTDATRWVGDIAPDKLDLLIRKLQQKKAPGDRTAGRIPRRPRTGAPIPLAFGQQQLWFLEQMDPGTPVYNLPAAIRGEGRLRPDVLERCLAEIERRHEILRTRFTVVDGVPVQIPLAFESTPAVPRLPLVDLSGLPGAARAPESARLAAEEARLPFDLNAARPVRATLLRFGPEEHLLLLTQHHIASDVWSIGLLVRELGELYRAFAAGRPSPLPEPEVQFADFVEWQREHYRGETLDQLVAWWKERLGAPGDKTPAGFELPTDRPRPALQTFHGAAERIEMDQAAVETLRRLASAEGTTLFTALLTAGSAVLARWAGRDDVIVGTAAASRPDRAVESLIGLFLDTIVLRTDLGGDPTFREALSRTRETALGAFGHPIPFPLLVEALQPERDLSRSPLFQIFFSLQTVGLPALELPELTLRPQEIHPGTTQFDLGFYLTDTSAGVTGWIEYNTDLYEPATIRRLARSLAILVAGAAAGPDQALSKLPILSLEDEKNLAAWSRLRPEILSVPALIHELFRAHAARTPEAIAAIHRHQSWTFRELDAESDAVAQALAGLGIRPGNRVGLCAERSLPMLAGLLGILKAGAAYVPLDPSYPEGRLSMMLEDSQAQGLVVFGERAQRLAEGQAFLDLRARDGKATKDNKGEPLMALPSLMSLAEAPAYIIYTSGSTGIPKGVVLTHANVTGFFAAMDEVLDADLPGVWLAVTSISFDISVLELLWTLTRGYQVVIQDELAHTSEDADFSIPAQIARHGVTHLQCTPSLAGILAADPGTLQALAPLRALLLGGEALPAPLAATLRGAVRGQILDVYGPTEATIWSTVHRIEEVGERVPVGRPLANNTVRLLDRRLLQVPPGMPGEVWLGGDGMASGYWLRPDLTADHFLPDPFAASPGSRMYRTGDLARWNPDATLDFLGRADHQVKVRGHRIELGEVEAALRSHPDVREAAVIVRDDSPERRLVGYVVPAREPLSASDLRLWLADRLPEPWLPSDFVMLEFLPLTGSGKIDRRALLAPGTGRPALEAAYVAPSTSIEQNVADVWCEILGREKVGVHDNFFEVGGSSLLLVRIHARLREVLDREVTMVQLFRNPTVQALARFLETQERESRALADAEDRQRRAGTVQQSAAVDRQRQFLEEQRRRKEAGRRR